MTFKVTSQYIGYVSSYKVLDLRLYPLYSLTGWEYKPETSFRGGVMSST